MKAETLADYRTRIADRTLITLSVVSIERILDERLRLLAALYGLEWSRTSEYDPCTSYCPTCAGKYATHAEACRLKSALAYAEESVP